jgi:hypothetical protein
MDRTVWSSGGSARLGAHRDIKRIWALLRGGHLCPLHPAFGRHGVKQEEVNQSAADTIPSEIAL